VLASMEECVLLLTIPLADAIPTTRSTPATIAKLQSALAWAPRNATLELALLPTSATVLPLDGKEMTAVNPSATMNVSMVTALDPILALATLDMPDPHAKMRRMSACELTSHATTTPSAPT